MAFPNIKWDPFAANALDQLLDLFKRTTLFRHCRVEILLLLHLNSFPEL